MALNYQLKAGERDVMATTLVSPVSGDFGCGFPFSWGYPTERIFLTALGSLDRQEGGPSLPVIISHPG